MKLWWFSLAIGLAVSLVSGFARAQNTVGFNIYDYLVPSACYPPKQILTPSACPRLNAGDAAPYRAMDWGTADFRQGYQAVDNALVGDGFVEAVKSFNYDNPNGLPGPYNPSFGDGGDLYGVAPGPSGYGNVAYATFTEDGGAGRQWICGDGWWLFSDQVTVDHWEDALIRLSISRTGYSACPGLGSAYTRWRRFTPLQMPMAVRDAQGNVTTDYWNLDGIVSEHYAGTSIANATSMERFYFIRGFGELRWEAWSTQSPAVAMGYRCPAVTGGGSPGPGWNLVDCRNWTNFIKPPSGWSVNTIGWPLSGVPH